jgi:hypothetical protein
MYKMSSNNNIENNGEDFAWDDPIPTSGGNVNESMNQ